MEIKSFSFNLFQENSILVSNGNRCAVVDPGFCARAEEDAFLGELDSRGLKPDAVLLTHGHLDHIYGAKKLQDKYGCKVYMSEEDVRIFPYNSVLARGLDMPEPDCGFKASFVADGDTVRAAGLDFKVIATPGHTPGSVCWYCEGKNLLFTGDTLMKGTIGRTDLKYGDYDAEIVSIMEKIMALPAETDFFPGHGPSSSLSEERTGNPMLEPFNEPGQDYSI